MSTNSTLDDFTNATDEADTQQQREDVLDGGARYRHPIKNHDTDDEHEIVDECQGCGSHVQPQYVRVLGVNGRVDKCPRCATTREIVGGRFADTGGDR